MSEVRASKRKAASPALLIAAAVGALALPSAVLAFSQSPTVIVPSGRSAMTCTVVPLADDTFTRTSR